MLIGTAQPVRCRGCNLLNDAVHLETQALNLFVPRRQRFLYCNVTSNYSSTPIDSFISWPNAMVYMRNKIIFRAAIRLKFLIAIIRTTTIFSRDYSRLLAPEQKIQVCGTE